MSQRPQPVTSKFRNHYLNDIYPVFDYQNKSSSAGSTSSLTSVLYHDSFDDEKSIDKSLFENDEIKDALDQVCFDSKPSTGMYCKRIIARQPHYPGERVTMTKYDSTINTLCKTAPTRITVKPRISSKQRLNSTATKKIVVASPNFNCGIITPQKAIVRKIANRSQSESEKSNSKKKQSNQDNKSEDGYSTNDFSSISGESPGTQILEEKIANADVCSSIDGTLSVSLDVPHNESDDVPIHKESKSKKILTAWEAWYLKKEKQKRQNQDTELAKEKEKKETEEDEKFKRTQICQEKIQNWLIKKEEIQKKEAKTTKRQQVIEKNLKEQKKEELLKKSSEKFVEWKLAKEKREKESEKNEQDLKIKLEAEKMIKKAKAANAFQRWFEEHKDHQMTVPYSYGISDGKLTSYYDKTSNPPPSFFNPDPWKPVIDTKH